MYDCQLLHYAEDVFVNQAYGCWVFVVVVVLFVCFVVFDVMKLHKGVVTPLLAH